MTVQSPVPIGMPSKLARRFYEPLKIEETLVKASKNNEEYSGKVSYETETGLENGDEKAFHSCLNKMAHICDTCKGGTTVSAAAVIEEFDGLRFILASNSRTASERIALESFFRKLLQLTNGTASTEPMTEGPQFLRVLKHIVVFNQPRIRLYTKLLVMELRRCLDSSNTFDGQQTEDAKDGEHIRTFLGQLRDFLPSAAPPGAEAHVDNQSESLEPDNSSLSFELIRFLDQAAKRGNVAVAISRLCSRHHSVKKWQQLRHLLARLRAYHVSAETIVACRQRWPQLFEEDVKITVLPSSKPDKNPFKSGKSSIQAALGRFTSEGADVTKLRADMQWLGRFDLEEIYQELLAKEAFKPLVHAEILVYNYTYAYLKENPGFQYWRSQRYIGTSKPTCRLCHYYFQEVDDDVLVRESHGNLYSKWRLPDCFDEESFNQRKEILINISKRTRKDTVRVMQGKLPRGSSNDSNTFSTVPSELRKGIHRNDVIPELTEAFNRVSILGGEITKAQASTYKQENFGLGSKAWQVEEMTRELIVEDEEVDDEDGGVLIA